MLHPEKQTSNAISFKVEIKSAQDPSASASPPSIKKRLEETTRRATAAPTIDQIAEKLKRAEQKRRQSHINHIESINLKERRRHAAIDQRKSIERVQNDMLKVKIYQGLTKADEKRISEQQRLRAKLRNHISKVEEVCKGQATRRQVSVETLRKELTSRLDSASLKREHLLQAKVSTAVKLAEKKMQIVEPAPEVAPAESQ